MGDGTRKYENAVDGQRYQKEVKISVVPLSNTIAHPRTMMIKPLHTIVAYRAMRGARWPKYTASEAVLEIKDIMEVIN